MDKGGKKLPWFAGYYFHLEPGKSFLGGGLRTPSTPKAKFRQEIDYCLDVNSKIVSSKKIGNHLWRTIYREGIQLSRFPGLLKNNPAAGIPFLKTKVSYLYLLISLMQNLLQNLVSKTVDAFYLMQPFYKILKTGRLAYIIMFSLSSF